MKKIVSFLLAMLLLVTANSAGLSALSEMEFQKAETPIAQIANDIYQPYSATTTDSTPNQTNITYDYMDFSFEPVTQTITVMTTATGSEARGNYVASKPVKNALVRLDGVPRYTDSNGQIRAVLSREYVELFVEKDGYNPYIEVIEATNVKKVVHLKQPNDDIEIISAMFQYKEDSSNLLVQSYGIIEGTENAYNKLDIDCNIEADEYYLLVNGDRVDLCFDGQFEFINFDKYSEKFGVDDKDNILIHFSIQVEYEGVVSKEIDLNLTIQRPDMNKIADKIAEQMEDEGNFNGDIGNEGEGFGSAGSIDFDWKNLKKELLNILCPKDFHKLDIKIPGTPIKITFVYWPRKNQLDVMLGVYIKIPLGKEIVLYDSKAEAAKLEKEYAELTKGNEFLIDKYLESKEKVDELETEIQKLEQATSNRDEVVADYKELKKAEIANLKKIKEQCDSAKGSSEYLEAKDELRKAQNAYQTNLKYHEDQYKKTSQAIDNAMAQLDTAKENAFSNLMDLIFKQGECERLTGEIKNLLKGNTKSALKFNLEINIIGKLVFSLAESKVLEAQVYGEIKPKVTYTYQSFFMAGPVPIPFFVQIAGGIGAKFIFLEYKDGHPFKSPLNMSFGEFLDQIQIALLIYIRVDIALGVAGIASIGGFGTADFEFWWKNPKYVDGKAGFFRLGIGFKVQFLIFEYEYGIKTDPIYFYGEEVKTDPVIMPMALMDRSLSSISISDKQVADGIYQSSIPQIVPLDNGTQLLTWIEDDPLRDTYNRTALKFAIYEDGILSEPQYINDGNADFGQTLYVQNGKIYISWQRCDKIITETDTAESILSACEIFVAEFDQALNEFVNIQRITDDNVMSANPQFVINAQQPTIVWQTNSNGDFFGFSGQNAIFSSSLIDGEWTQPVLQYLTDKPINSFSAAMKNGELIVAVEENIGEDIFSSESVLIVNIDGSNTFVLGLQANNPQFVILDGEINLLFNADDGIYVTSDFVNKYVAIQDEAFSRDFRVNNLGTAPIIIYEKSVDGIRQSVCAIYQNGIWVKDIILSDEINPDNTIFSTVAYHSDTGIKFVYNVCDLENNIVLCYEEKNIQSKIEIDAYFPYGFENGEMTDIRLYVKNVGDTLIDKLKIEVCGQLIIIDCVPTLAIGDYRYFDVAFIATLVHGEKMRILTYAVDDGDTILATATCELQTTFSNMVVSYSMQIINGKQTYFIEIENLSDYIGNATVYIFFNFDTYMMVDVSLSSGENWKYSLNFDEIRKSDSVCFYVATEIDDMNINDKFCGFFSIQDELHTQLKYNPFKDILDSAKVVLL